MYKDKKGTLLGSEISFEIWLGKKSYLKSTEHAVSNVLKQSSLTAFKSAVLMLQILA